MNSKSQLAIALSKLKAFVKPNVKLEQYPTDSEIAAGALWNLALLGDIEGKAIADLGCGTGILGIGALMMGAKKVWFVDVDAKVLEVLKENLDDLGIEEDYEIFKGKVSDFNEKVDVVVQNPPFGTKQEHADKVFLEKAFSIADVVCSFHKTVTRVFVEAISADHGKEITHRWDFSFPLKQTQKFHKSKIRRVEVTCFRMV
ncbi:METTL5 family protein [Nanoarchaeota archaeon]